MKYRGHFPKNRRDLWPIQYTNTFFTNYRKVDLIDLTIKQFSLMRFSLLPFFTYFFQIVFNRNHMWIRCKILISVQGECRRRGRNHCCGRGDWIGWEWRGAERGEFIWLPRPSSFLLLIHSVDIIGEISVRSRNYKKNNDFKMINR